MNLSVGVDPAALGSEMTAVVIFKVVSQTWQSENVMTVTWPTHSFLIPEGCLAVWADEEF